MTYARKRLWLGISGVGLTVVVSLAAVVFHLPHRLIPPDADRQFTTALAATALVWMLHALLLLPLDIIGGLVVVREKPGVLRWIAAWLRGVTVQWLWYALAAALLLRTGQQFGRDGRAAGVPVAAVGVAQPAGAGGVAGGRLAHRAGLAGAGGGGRCGRPWAPRRVREIGCDDPAFTGAWSGTSAQRLWVPQRWGQVAAARAAGSRAGAPRRRAHAWPAPTRRFAGHRLEHRRLRARHGHAAGRVAHGAGVRDDDGVGTRCGCSWACSCSPPCRGRRCSRATSGRAHRTTPTPWPPPSPSSIAGRTTRTSVTRASSRCSIPCLHAVRACVDWPAMPRPSRPSRSPAGHGTPRA